MRKGRYRQVAVAFGLAILVIAAAVSAFAQNPGWGGPCFSLGLPGLPGGMVQCREDGRWAGHGVFYGIPYHLLDTYGPDGRVVRLRQRDVAWLFVDDVLIGRLSDFSPVPLREERLMGDFRLEFHSLDSETYASAGVRTGYRLVDEAGRVAEVFANGIYIGRLHRNGVKADLDSLSTGIRNVSVRPELWEPVPSHRD